MDQLDLGAALFLPAGIGGGIVAPVGSPGEAQPRAPGDEGPAPQFDLGPLALLPEDYAREGARGGGALVADGPGDGERRLKFKKGSPELLAYARQAKAAKAQKEKISALEKTATQATTALSTVTGLLPDVAALVGRPKSASIVGRMKKNLSPSHFVMLVRAAFLPTKSNVSVGVKLKRLVCIVCKYILLRQCMALDFILRACRVYSEQQEQTPLPQKALHISYSHMWDETLVRAASRRAQKFRQTRLHIGTQTICQRGSFRLAMLNSATGASSFTDAAWLCRPWQVSGTSAKALHLAVVKNMPSFFNFNDADGLEALASSVSHVTFMPLCDKASGNLAIMRHWGAALKLFQGAEVQPSPHLVPSRCLWCAHTPPRTTTTEEASRACHAPLLDR